MGKGALHVFYIEQVVGSEVGLGDLGASHLPCLAGLALKGLHCLSGLPSTPMSDGCVHAYNALTPVYADQIPEAAIGLITTQVKRVAH